jgi:hypothetical protein
MTLVLDEPVLEELRTELRGAVIGPADVDYDAARKVHNGMIDTRLAVIARCTRRRRCQGRAPVRARP